MIKSYQEFEFRFEEMNNKYNSFVDRNGIRNIVSRIDKKKYSCYFDKVIKYSIGGW